MRTHDPTVARYWPWRGQSDTVAFSGFGPSGLRARGWRPADPAACAIFGAALHAPCDGIVAVAVAVAVGEGAWPDFEIPQEDSVNRFGNHVILHCGDMRCGIVTVTPGEGVMTGTRLGVGNSRAATEPHLHIHARRLGAAEAPISGEPLGLRIDGRFLLRGDRLRGRDWEARTVSGRYSRFPRDRHQGAAPQNHDTRCCPVLHRTAPMLSLRSPLLTGGALIAAGGGAWMLTGGPDHAAAAARIWSPRDPARLERLVHYATRAANSHNAQAWRFRPTVEGLAILPDMSRALPQADGDHHHLYAFPGCAAENLMLAAGAAGRSSALSFTPGGDGRVEIALAEGVGPIRSSRRSSPANAQGRTTTAAGLAALEAAARVDGAEVMLITHPVRIAQVLEMILSANAAQVSDPAFAAELKSWLRFNGGPVVETGDGFHAATSGNPTLPGFLGRFMFDRFFTVKAENDRSARQVRSSAGLAIIHSDRDDPAHWVQAGRACQRFALQATAPGIRHAHLNQPVEVAATGPQLQSLLGLGDRRPDMVLRFGDPPPMPRSLRRPVAAVIDA